MALLKDLVGKQQRESAGADTASRFDYQKNWAFCEMVKRHMAGADYLVAFEFHDDVVFLEPANTPSRAELYQVKTSKSGKPRTLGSLLSRDADAGSLSILGKMCVNFNGICWEHDVRVILVSNIPFAFAAEEACAGELKAADKKLLIKKLTAEIPSMTADRLSNMYFLVTGVSLDAMQSYLHGQAAELFKHEFGEDHGLNIHSWIRLVQGEVGRRNNFPSDKIGNVEDLVQKKCISREFISDTMACAAKSRSVPPDMQLINQMLLAAGWTASTLMRIGKKLPSATYDYSDATNLEAARIIERIEILLGQQDSEDLPQFLEAVSNQLLASLDGPYSDVHYLWALAILVFHEKI